MSGYGKRFTTMNADECIMKGLFEKETKETKETKLQQHGKMSLTQVNRIKKKTQK